MAANKQQTTKEQQITSNQTQQVISIIIINKSTRHKTQIKLKTHHSNKLRETTSITAKGSPESNPNGKHS